MTEVSSVPLQPDGNTSFLSSALHRSHSLSSFLVRSSSLRHAQEPYARTEYNSRIPTSAYSTASSYPRTPQADSWDSPLNTPTPTASLPLDTKRDDDQDQVVFPSNDGVGDCKRVVDLEPPASPRTDDSYTVSPASNSTSANNSRPDSLIPAEHAEHAEDDTAVRSQPSRYVDYLSHDWEEEDIWSSWKHIVSKREVYGNTARLENASWRTWTKSKYRLKTVSPETLNWLKDCEITWLYGPLQTSSDKLSMPSSSPAGSGISKSNSFLNKKPILKKRSVSEIMLQRSLYTVQAQQSDTSLPSQKFDRPSMGRATSDNVALPLPSRSLNRDNVSEFSSVSSLGEQSLAANERRHIHFNNKVEQWIAVDVEDVGDDEDGGDSYPIHDDNDSSSDDGLMMKGSSKPNIPNRSNRSSSRNTFSAERRSIAILPSTMLKCREDAPELTELAIKQDGGFWSTGLSPSPSQESFQPPQPSSNILLDNDEEHADMLWTLSSVFANHKDSISAMHDRFVQNGSLEMNGAEGEDDVGAAGLFGWVVDNVNTAKDIAYVIWNVG